MKKLMIAAVIVCAAVASQAASFNWEQTKGTILDGSNKGKDTPVYTGGTAYLINGDITSQQALLTAALGAGFDITDYAIAGSAGLVEAGLIQKTSDFNYDVSSSFSAYYAIVENGKIFISDAVDSGFQEATTQPISFGTSPKKNSAAMLDSATFTTANAWYQTAAVPEPTSGLLLLLGVAGLALRRRRA